MVLKKYFSVVLLASVAATPVFAGWFSKKPSCAEKKIKYEVVGGTAVAKLTMKALSEALKDESNTVTYSCETDRGAVVQIKRGTEWMEFVFNENEDNVYLTQTLVNGRATMYGTGAEIIKGVDQKLNPEESKRVPASKK